MKTDISTGVLNAFWISSSVAPCSFIALYLSLCRIERFNIPFTSEAVNALVKGALGLALFSLENAGYKVTDLTKDALAKDHIRYMIGGHLATGEAERLILFEFPETKGALNDFLTKLGGIFSISLFHFRISGLEYCSVLCGFDVTKGDQAQLERFLQEIKYPYLDVTDNIAYQQFLC